MPLRILTLIFLLNGAVVSIAEELHVSPAISVANGSMVVMRTSQADPSRLLIHFHGAAETVKSAFERSEAGGVLVVVNFPGLSTSYSRPFADDPEVFDQILRRARAEVADGSSVPNLDWGQITLSSFSAGYGAVRQILKTAKHFERIDGIIAADSIYAGLQRDEPKREVAETDMRDFLKFASLAVQEKKAFVLSHSSQATPYASTTETADYLLRSLKLDRISETAQPTKSMHLISRAQRGQFLVLGFDGTSGKEHMQHLHHIDLLWRRMPH